MRADKENWIAKEVTKGNYILMIKTPWKSYVNEFSFSVYGPDKTKMTQVNESSISKNFFYEVLLSHAKVDKTEPKVSFTR